MAKYLNTHYYCNTECWFGSISTDLLFKEALNWNKMKVQISNRYTIWEIEWKMKAFEETTVAKEMPTYIIPVSIFLFESCEKLLYEKYFLVFHLLSQFFPLM